MPYLVNGQLVPEDVIREESDRISRDPRWLEIASESERARQLRVAAEQCAVDRVIIEQLAMADPRPVDAAEVERELARIRGEWGCRSDVNETGMRSFVVVIL